MPKSKKIFRIAALTAVTILCPLSITNASGLNQFIGLGDSTLDTGYFRYHTMGSDVLNGMLATAIAAGANGGFAGNGIMATTILAEKFGLSAAPIGGGGTNYANGGSLTATSSLGNVPLTEQISNYLGSVNGVANPNALYVISSGNNDMTHSSPDPNFLSQQASALAASVATLQNAGARIILVPNSFRYANLASFGGTITDGTNAAEYARLSAYHSERWSDLSAAGVHFIPADLDSVFKFVARNPTRFGFTASSVLASSSPSSVAAIFSVLTEEQQQTYLFIDGKHLTTAGQTIEADYTYSLLTAPSQISLLAESAVQSGLVHTQTIQGHIDLSQQHRGERGINVWGNAGANTLKIDNATGFTNDSGTPFYGAVGIDYLTRSGVIVGAAYTAGKQTQDFSSGGNFDQEVEAPSLYAAYKTGAIWGNAVATYGFLQNNIERQVTLGRFTELNHADTNGHSLLLALRGGYDCSLRQQITTGPVLGVTVQQVRLDGFTETDTSGVTALSFGNQTRDSVVSQLGWRASMELGSWKPFVEAEWNHEWAAKDRTVTASLTSVSAPSYTMDAAPITSDWATASLGTSYHLTPLVMLRGVASGMFLNSQVTSYGGEVGLSVSF